MNSGNSFSPFVITAGIKTLMVLLPGLGFALYIAVQIGSEEYTLPIFLLLGIIAAMGVGLLTRNTRVEAVILGFLLIGYFVGSRGFADLSVGKPFYVGEVSLAAIALTLLSRRILSGDAIDMRGLLPRLVLLYLSYAVLRWSFDVKTYRLDAVRDLAIVYYCVFFYFACQVSRYSAERAFIDKCLSFAFFGQTVIAVISILRPEWFDVTEGSISILFAQKGDLIATFSGAGIFFLYTRERVFGFKWLRVALICLLFATIGMSIARSAIIALVVTSSLMWFAGRWRYFLYPIGLIAVGAFTLMVTVAFVDEGDQNNQIVHFQEKLLSIGDYSGRYQYQTDLGEMKSHNNEFRLVFWKSVIDETTADHPVIGKGFGYDFLKRFEQVYNRGAWEGLRSPHNYFVSVYGRMGIIGLLLFGAIVFNIFRQGLAAALLVRHGKLPVDVLGYWGGTWMILISGTVGVVLEGPMGGITFWTLLGLAFSCSKLSSVESATPKAEFREKEPLPMLQHVN